MIAALVAALIGGFVGVTVTFALVRVLRQHHRRKVEELAYIQASNAQAGSTATWKNASSPSLTSANSAQLKRKISEPILLKNFEGDGITLSPHMSEMLGVHSKRACRALSPLTFSSRTSLGGIPSGPGSDEASGSQSPNNAGVPMLFRQPRRKSVSTLQRGPDFFHSAESMYSKASASSPQLLARSAARPEIAPSASDASVELVSIRKTENRGSQSWILDPSTTRRVSTSVGAFNQVRHPYLLGHFSDFSRRALLSLRTCISHPLVSLFSIQPASNRLAGHRLTARSTLGHLLHLCPQLYQLGRCYEVDLFDIYYKKLQFHIHPIHIQKKIFSIFL